MLLNRDKLMFRRHSDERVLAGNLSCVVAGIRHIRSGIQIDSLFDRTMSYCETEPDHVFSTDTWLPFSKRKLKTVRALDPCVPFLQLLPLVARMDDALRCTRYHNNAFITNDDVHRLSTTSSETTRLP